MTERRLLRKLKGTYSKVRVYMWLYPIDFRINGSGVSCAIAVRVRHALAVAPHLGLRALRAHRHERRRRREDRALGQQRRAHQLRVLPRALRGSKGRLYPSILYQSSV